MHSISYFWIMALKNARAKVFLKLGRADKKFRLGPQTLDFFLELLLPVSTSPEMLLRDGIGET